MTIRSGCINITPAQSLPLFGRIGRSKVSTSVSSQLEANVIIYGQGDARLILVGLDTLYPSNALLDAVHDLLIDMNVTIPKDGIMMVASHTHNAPALDPTKPLLGKVDYSYFEETAQKIARLIRRLDMQTCNEVQIWAGQSICDASVYRRKNAIGLRLWPLGVRRQVVLAPVPSVSIDQRLRFFMWLNEEDKPSAVIWHWPCHAVTTADKQTISADFPGNVRQALREKLGDLTLPVIYMPGFSADIRPCSQSRIPLLRSEGWLGIGYRFAKNTPQSEQVFADKVAQAMLKAYDTCTHMAHSPNIQRETRFLNLDALRQDADSNAPPISIQNWSFGGVEILGVSAELSHDYGTQGDIHILETGCAQQVFGYLPTDTNIREGGYEADGFAWAFSVSGRFRGAIEHTVRKALKNDCRAQ